MADPQPERFPADVSGADEADAVLADGVLRALHGVLDPEIRRPVTELDMISGVRVDARRATVDVRLTIVGCPAAHAIERDVRNAAASVAGVDDVEVRVSVMTAQQRNALTERLRAGRPRGIQFGPDSLTKVFAVTSGKGGVGKSTVTANLAVALAARGLAVGLVDVDVFGFSIPGLLGVEDAVPTRVNDMILPPVAHGVKAISIGMFLEPSDDPSPGRGSGQATGSGQAGKRRPQAVSWRGPMLHRTVQQFLTDVWFGDLDVLLLDLPPGTGDVAISVGQLLPHAEVLVVTTPQIAAADVAERSGLAARQTGQTVSGVIENMAGLAQPDGSVLDLFGSGGGAEVAGRLGVPLLASVPISVPLRVGGDIGVPIVLSDPADPAAVALTAVAEQLAGRTRGLAGKPLGLAVT
ncbi:Mrp/NBP35 family ATP-binding protein [Lysobacter korlensis]|uniref:Iron-sulfur cluster carrier protein n=1 Tax=Lysobacter korlensis TaxID=553636 RepID=A0ABV6RZN7_9GAMM